FVRASKGRLKEFQRCVEKVHLNYVGGGFLRLDMATKWKMMLESAIKYRCLFTNLGYNNRKIGLNKNLTSEDKMIKEITSMKKLYPYDYEKKVNKMNEGLYNIFCGYDGLIGAWRGRAEANCPFKLVTSLIGHSKVVVRLTAGSNRLYLGSMYQIIKAWLLIVCTHTLECKMTLNGHIDIVTSLIYWNHYLLSSSSYYIIKVWVVTE
ncbi:Zinc finger CCCH domain-containing protein 63, partial [Mucuna pruriens]